MKILQFGKAYPPVNLGGVEATIKFITDGLHSKNIQCDVLGVNDKLFRNVEFIQFGKIIRAAFLFKAFSTLFSLDLIFQLYKINKNYDVIHIHHPDPMAGIALFLIRPQCKIIVHWHSDIIRQKFLLKFYSPVQEWILKRADLIIVTSPNYSEGSKFLASYLDKVRILPIGINDKSLVYDDCKVDSIKNTYKEKKIVLSIGRLAYYKGYEFLIESFKYLDESFVLLIIGEGKLKETLLKYVADLNLQNRIFFLGRVNDLDRNSYLKACDVFVLSSIFKTEAFGIVQIEAMSFKKPVVSTEIYGSGVSWVNKNEFSGITVPISNSLEIALAIKKICLNLNSYEQYSNGAGVRFNEEFTLDKMITKLIELYKNIL